MIYEIIKKAELHIKRAKAAMDEIKSWDFLDISIFEDFEKIKTIDTFIYRFIKTQDIMGDKLFRTLLNKIGEYKDNMSLLDILDKLEKLEIINSSNEWMEYRQLRNKLTHEYPDNENEVLEGIKIALEDFDNIMQTLNNIVNYINKKI